MSAVISEFGRYRYTNLVGGATNEAAGSDAPRLTGCPAPVWCRAGRSDTELQVWEPKR